jgi:3-phenylpropionate/trans-cinnamate dioxygenase ferredoxin reductase subunit
VSGPTSEARMSATPKDIVIVGGGLAGAKAAEALRADGFDGTVTLVGQEVHLPYERPPLSKGYLMDQSPFADAIVHDHEWYARNDVDIWLGSRADSIHPGRHEVSLSDGAVLRYDKLLLATGALPRRLQHPGSDARGVLYLRNREDSDAVRQTFGAGRHLIIIGAGWIGLEVASAARQAGTTVTVIEMASLPLVGVLGPKVAEVFAALHRDNGVDLRLDARLQEIIVADGWAAGVRLDDGSTIPGDAVLVGVGVAPNVALAEAAGLQCDNGILVDAALRSSDPDIYAVGDVANHAHPALGVRVRVEHWATALNQPAVAAAAMLGNDVTYEQLPYFFSDQYDLGLEYIGFAPTGSYTQVVVRGELTDREFVAFWLDDANQVKAAMNVNTWDVVDAVRPLIRDGKPVDPQRLTDPDVEYGDL